MSQLFCKELSEAQDMAASAAISQGYDQVVYLKPRRGFSFARTTNNVNPRRIIGYVRLTYKDGVLGTTYCER